MNAKAYISLKEEELTGKAYKIIYKHANGDVIQKGEVVAAMCVENEKDIQLKATHSGQFYVCEKVHETSHKSSTGNTSTTNSTNSTNNTKSTNNTSPIGYILYCPHEIRTAKRCLQCLALIQDEDTVENPKKQEDTVQVMFSHGQQYYVNKAIAQKLDLDNITRQLTAQRLSLILDLDHTLLHATASQEGQMYLASKEYSGVYTFDIAIPSGHLASRRPPSTSRPMLSHYVKLRPHLHSFLEKMAQIYDLHVYTQGTREYALQILHIIDPTNRYFRQRVVARTDTPSMDHKSLRLLFPSCDDQMIVVLDDKALVWKENMQNVLVIPPYHFFHGMEDINNTGGDQDVRLHKINSQNENGNNCKSREREEKKATYASERINNTEKNLISIETEHSIAQAVEEIDAEETNSTGDDKASLTSKQEGKWKDKEDDEGKDKDKQTETDDYLLTMGDILHELHRRFYATNTRETVTAQMQIDGQGRDVRMILGKMQKEVLQSCVLTFSGLLPIRPDIKPENTEIWTISKMYGAIVHHNVENDTTHLVLSRDRCGTAKHKKARKRGIHVVDVRWLYDSIQKWKKLPEEAYRIDEGISNKNQQIKSIESQQKRIDKNGERVKIEKTEENKERVKNRENEIDHAQNKQVDLLQSILMTQAKKKKADIESGQSIGGKEKAKNTKEEEGRKKMSTKDMDDIFTRLLEAEEKQEKNEDVSNSHPRKRHRLFEERSLKAIHSKEIVERETIESEMEDEEQALNDLENEILS